jgi:hypothetical protein
VPDSCQEKKAARASLPRRPLLSPRTTHGLTLLAMVVLSPATFACVPQSSVLYRRCRCCWPVPVGSGDPYLCVPRQAALSTSTPVQARVSLPAACDLVLPDRQPVSLAVSLTRSAFLNCAPVTNSPDRCWRLPAARQAAGRQLVPGPAVAVRDRPHRRARSGRDHRRVRNLARRCQRQEPLLVDVSALDSGFKAPKARADPSDRDGLLRSFAVADSALGTPTSPSALTRTRLDSRSTMVSPRLVDRLTLICFLVRE